MNRDTDAIRPACFKPGLGMAVFACLLCPVTLLADVGTPLVWTSAFHLFLGNALIGICEGSLLARVFQLPQARCRWLLIAANYLSAWGGLGLAAFLFEKFNPDIYSGLRVTWLLVLATYLLTLLIEWPFVALCLVRTHRWLLRSLKASLLVQSASYLVLFGGYWLVSSTSLYTGMEVVPPGAINPPAGVVACYISSVDGHVYRSSLGRSSDLKLAELGSTNCADFLELQQSQINTNNWDLVASMERNGPDEKKVLVRDVSTLERIPPKQGYRTQYYWGWGVTPFQVGAATNSAWHFGWAHWPDAGIWGREGARTVRIAYGTPIGGWSPYRVVHLPGDLLLLQLGPDQLCLVDFPNRKIARIRKGHGILAFQHDDILNLKAAP